MNAELLPRLPSGDSAGRHTRECGRRDSDRVGRGPHDAGISYTQEPGETPASTCLSTAFRSGGGAIFPWSGPRASASTSISLTQAASRRCLSSMRRSSPYRKTSSASLPSSSEKPGGSPRGSSRARASSKAVDFFADDLKAAQPGRTPMKILFAMDLIGGCCVRLARGDFERMTVYSRTRRP